MAALPGGSKGAFPPGGLPLQTAVFPIKYIIVIVQRGDMHQTLDGVGQFHIKPPIGHPNTVLNSLLDQKPVLLFGNGHFVDKNHQPIDDPIYDSTPGHGWLIDGYCLAKKSGQARNDQYWSVNMGWGKNSSYVYFKTQDNFQDCDVTFPYNDEGVNITYYTQEQCMIYNIVKR